MPARSIEGLNPAEEQAASFGGEERLSVSLGLLVVVVACLLVFFRTFGMDFVYDDVVLLKEPSLIWRQDIFKAAFGSESMASLGKSTPYYRPLLILSLALDHNLWGVKPAGFHVTNVLLHTVAAVLVFIVAHRLWRNVAVAGASALIFACHPVQAEAVTWISARCDIICAIFVMAAFWAYLEYADTRRTFVLGLSLIFFLGGLLAKEMGITLPAMIFLHALFARGERSKFPWQLSLYAVPVVIYLVLRFTFLPEQTWGGAPLLWRLYTGVGLVVRYIANVLFPFDLRVFYDITVQKTAGGLTVLMPAFLLFAAVALVVLVARRLPLAGFGLAWFFIALLPVSGLLTLIQPSLMADRYLYIPMIGIGLAFGGLMGELMKRRRILAITAGITLLTVSAGGACIRTNNWRDQSTFRDSVVRDAPESYFGYYFSGQKLLEAGRLDEALAAFSRTLQINATLSEAYAGRGLVYYQRGELPNAALDFSATLKYDPANWRVYTNLGVVYAQQGNMEEAARSFRKALQINPDDMSARMNLEKLSEISR